MAWTSDYSALDEVRERQGCGFSTFCVFLSTFSMQHRHINNLQIRGVQTELTADPSLHEIAKPQISSQHREFIGL